MKTLFVTIAIIISSLINNTYAHGGNNLNEQIKETVKFDGLTIEKNKTEFVRVSLRINEEGEISPIETNYSNEEVKNQLLEELKGVKIQGSVDTDKVYYYNFKFKKQ